MYFVEFQEGQITVTWSHQGRLQKEQGFELVPKRWVEFE